MLFPNYKLQMIPIQSELVLFHFKVSLRNKTQTLVEKRFRFKLTAQQVMEITYEEKHSLQI